MHTRIDESNTTEFNKMGVSNKEMVTNNCDKNWFKKSEVEKPTTKMALININF